MQLRSIGRIKFAKTSYIWGDGAGNICVRQVHVGFRDRTAAAGYTIRMPADRFYWQSARAAAFNQIRRACGMQKRRAERFYR